MSHEFSEIFDAGHRFLTAARAWDIYKWPVGGLGLSAIYAQVADAAQSHVVNLVAVGVLGVGSALIGLWRMYMLARIDIAEKERQSFARVPAIKIAEETRRKADVPPGA